MKRHKFTSVQLGLIGTYNFGRLSTLKSNILSTRKLRML